jgi:hypothetical protein
MGLFDYFSSNPSPDTLSNSSLEKRLELEYAWFRRNMANFEVLGKPSSVKRGEYGTALRKEHDRRKAIKAREVQKTMFLLLVAHEATLNNNDTEKGRQILMEKIEEISFFQNNDKKVNKKELEDANLTKLFYQYVDGLPQPQAEAVRIEILNMYSLT